MSGLVFVLVGLVFFVLAMPLIVETVFTVISILLWFMLIVWAACDWMVGKVYKGKWK